MRLTLTKGNESEWVRAPASILLVESLEVHSVGSSRVLAGLNSAHTSGKISSRVFPSLFCSLHLPFHFLEITCQYHYLCVDPYSKLCFPRASRTQHPCTPCVRVIFPHWELNCSRDLEGMRHSNPMRISASLLLRRLCHPVLWAGFLACGSTLLSYSVNVPHVIPTGLDLRIDRRYSICSQSSEGTEVQINVLSGNPIWRDLPVHMVRLQPRRGFLPLI